MAVTKLEILARAPYAGGCSFGDAGAYERIDGVLHFAVDPEHEANRAIVDLDRADARRRGPRALPGRFLPAPAGRPGARQPAAALRGAESGAQGRSRACSTTPRRGGADVRDRSRRRLPVASRLDPRLVRLAVGRHPRTGA